MTGKPAQFLAGLLLAWFAFLCLDAIASAQISPAEKQFAAPKIEVEKAVQSLQPRSGRLPILEGFVASDEGALDRYERGYYQYSIQVTREPSGRTNVRVTAKITAWYADNSPAKSEYRVLPSNGRLEADLLDRLQEALSIKDSAVTSRQRLLPTEKSVPVAETKNSSELPDNPGARSAPSFSVTRNASRALPSREEAIAGKTAPTPEDQRIQQLAQEAKDLEDILHNQAHPQNLISVKESHTPIYERPFDQAKVLFYGDAEDEFQIVDTAGEWVHVQISGISRGWIRRNQVTLPGSPDTPTAASTKSSGEIQQDSFHPTREENSMFPGNWSVLRGKTVKIIWVQPSQSITPDASKIDFAKSVFRKSYPQISENNSSLAGVVIVFDSEDGGMAAATTATLQQWNAGHLSDSAFWKQCWLDPADSFRQKQ